MRIPVTQADLAQGRLNKIARALQKALPNAQLGLMQAQNSLSVLLGYRDLHDVQSNVVSDIPSTTVWRRAVVNNTVAWNLYRIHNIPMVEASDIVQMLHLKALDVDAHTAEAGEERYRAEQKAKGRMVLLNDWDSYAQPHWNPMTPQLLDAGTPPYQWAILPDKQVFQWALLEHLIDQLPPDYAKDLQQDPRYRHYGNDHQRSIAFIAQELVPQACMPLEQAVKKRIVGCDGIRTSWVYAKDRVTGGYACIGRVVHNPMLDGIIPVIFPRDTDEVFHAIAQILCGEPVVGPAHPISKGDQDLYFNDLQRGFDYVQEMAIALRYGNYENHIQKFPESIRYRVQNGKPELCGHVFVEQGQTYIRNQNWLDIDAVPQAMKSTIGPLRTGQVDVAQPVAVPTSAAELHNQLRDYLETATKHAWNKLLNPQALAQLFASWSQTVTEPAIHGSKQTVNESDHKRLFGASDQRLKTPGFEKYIEALLTKELVECDEDGRVGPMSPEKQAMERSSMAENGARMRALCPYLSYLSDTTTGYLMHVVQRANARHFHYAGVVIPKAEDLEEIARIIMEVVFHLICADLGESRPDGPLDYRVLTILLSRDSSTDRKAEGFWQEYLQCVNYVKRMDSQQYFLQQCEAWRQQQEEQHALRSAGQYVASGPKIPRTQPRGRLSTIEAMQSFSMRMQSVAQRNPMQKTEQ